MCTNSSCLYRHRWCPVLDYRQSDIGAFWYRSQFPLQLTCIPSQLHAKDLCKTLYFARLDSVLFGQMGCHMFFGYLRLLQVESPTTSSALGQQAELTNAISWRQYLHMLWLFFKRKAMDDTRLHALLSTLGQLLVCNWGWLSYIYALLIWTLNVSHQNC